MTLHPTSGYSHSEETTNAILHGFGLSLAISGLTVAVVLASLRSAASLIVGCSIYGAALVLLYGSSMFYHATRSLRWKRVFLVLDHSCIYVFIAGTYTPFTLGPLRGGLGWTLFGVVWGLALLGIVKESIWQRRGGLMGALIYLGMGWLCLFAIVPLHRSMSAIGFGCLMLGGGLYSLGVAFYLWRKLKFHHTIWHLFVLAGSVAQFFAVLSILR